VENRAVEDMRLYYQINYTPEEVMVDAGNFTPNSAG